MNLIDDKVVEITNIFLNHTPIFGKIYDEIEQGYNFLAGKQYDKKALKWYEKQNRPANVFNILFPVFNTMIGEFILSDNKIRVYPRPGAEHETAVQLEDYLDNISISSEAKFELSKTLLAGLIRVGYIYARYSDEQQIDGSFLFSNEDEFGIMFDARARHPFLDDAKFILRSRWMEIDEIIRLAPHKASLIKERNTDLMGKALWETLSMLDPDFSQQMQNPMIQDRKNGKFRVIEFHEIRYENSPVAVDPATGIAEPFFLTGKKADLYRKFHPDHKILEKVAPVKYTTTIMPGVALTLESKRNNIQDGKFDIIPFFPYNYSRYTKDGFGIMRNTMGVQKDFNDQKNRATEAVDKSVNLPIFYKPSNLLNPKEVEYYGAKTGIKVQIKEGKQIDDSVHIGKGIQWPFTVDNLSKEDEQLLMRIASITPNFLGLSEHSQEPASLFAQKLRQAQKSIAVMDMNFRMLKKRLAEKAIKALQQNVKTEKYFYMAGSGKTIGFNIPAAGRILFNLDIGDFDVFIDTLQQDPTARQIRFMQKTELVQMIVSLFGPQAIDPEWWLSESDLGDMSKVIDRINQIMQENAIQAEKQNAVADQATVMNLAKQKLNLQGEEVK